MHSVNNVPEECQWEIISIVTWQAAVPFKGEKGGHSKQQIKLFKALLDSSTACNLMSS